MLVHSLLPFVNTIFNILTYFHLIISCIPRGLATAFRLVDLIIIFFNTTVTSPFSIFIFIARSILTFNARLITITISITRSVFALTTHHREQRPRPTPKVKVSLTHAPFPTAIYHVLLSELKFHLVRECIASLTGFLEWLDSAVGAVLLAGLDLVGKAIKLPIPRLEHLSRSLLNALIGPYTPGPIERYQPLPHITSPRADTSNKCSTVRRRVPVSRTLIPELSVIRRTRDPPIHKLTGDSLLTSLSISNIPLRCSIADHPVPSLTITAPRPLTITATPNRRLITHATSQDSSTPEEAALPQGEAVGKEIPDSGTVALCVIEEPDTTVDRCQQEEIGLRTLTSGHNLVEVDYPIGFSDSPGPSELRASKDARLFIPLSPGSDLSLTSPALSFGSCSSGSSPWDTYSRGSPDLFSPVSSPDPAAPKGSNEFECSGHWHDDLGDDDISYYNPLDGFKQEGLLKYLTLDSLRPIGKGAFGVVWKAFDDQGGEYAVKVCIRTPENEIALFQEIHALNKAHGSPWVANLYHFDFSDTEVLFVTQFCSGGELMDLWDLYPGPVKSEVAVFYAAELILAVHDLHTRGILHRDIKFDNVMLRNGHVRIVDFGLAVCFDHDSVSENDFPSYHRLKTRGRDSFPPLKATSFNPHIARGAGGTPGYGAPEVWANRKYSFGVDYFSIGVMLHAMLTGDLPYYFSKNLNDYDFDCPVIDQPGLLNEVQRDFLEKMLSPDPLQRPAVRHMKAHPIFKDIDWDALEHGELEPPPL